MTKRIGVRTRQTAGKSPLVGEVAFDFVYRVRIRSFIKDDEFSYVSVKKVIAGGLIGPDCYAVG